MSGNSSFATSSTGLDLNKPIVLKKDGSTFLKNVDQVMSTNNNSTLGSLSFFLKTMWKNLSGVQKFLVVFFSILFVYWLFSRWASSSSGRSQRNEYTGMDQQQGQTQSLIDTVAQGLGIGTTSSGSDDGSLLPGLGSSSGGGNMPQEFTETFLSQQVNRSMAGANEPVPLMHDAEDAFAFSGDVNFHNLQGGVSENFLRIQNLQLNPDGEMGLQPSDLLPQFGGAGGQMHASQESPFALYDFTPDPQQYANMEPEFMVMTKSNKYYDLIGVDTRRQLVQNPTQPDDLEWGRAPM